MPLDLVPLWTALLALAVFYYVVFDGFDLGVGILYGLVRGDAARATVMNSIAPVWDGNETWLVFGGIGLLAAFPLAFAIIIPAVYFPILMMLLALVFRGVAFEFRFKHPAVRRFWDGAFCGGSLVLHGPYSGPDVRIPLARGPVEGECAHSRPSASRSGSSPTEPRSSA